MEKLLIVDDEEWIVEGLKLQLPWEQYGIELTNTASSGMEAIEIIKNDRPSIILSDIRMPQMDGLELAEYICSNNIESELIIISGYADFEYAKKAISYGVAEYLTKPIESEELEHAIHNVLKKLEEKRSANKKIIELQRAKENKQLCEKYLKENTAVEDGSEGKKYIMTVFHMNSFKSKIGEEDPRNYFLELLRNYLSEDAQTIVFQNRFEAKQYIMITENDVHADYEEQTKALKTLIKRVLAKIKREIDLEGVVGISDFYEKTNQSFKAYLQTKFIVENITSNGACNIVVSSEFKNVHSKIEIEHETIKKMMNVIENGNKREALEICEYLSEKWLSCSYPIMSMRLNVQEIIISLSQTLTKWGDNMYDLNHEYADIFAQIWRIESCEKLMELVYVLVEATLEHVRLSKGNGKESLIEGIKKYIDVHYADPLNLAEMANMFYVNSTYLSRAFKQEVGTGFNDYLRKRRLEVSAELLENTNLKIYEVAYRVGFDNPNYFMKKFQEFYGVTPGKYREENS